MIFTFYSYKGGVGRSMAMANVAHWLYQRGLNVVLVDWDLEAPGLESFFTQSPEELEKIRSQLGVIDLLYAYMRQFRFLPKEKPFDALPPLKESLCPLHPPATGFGSAPGTLRLLSAGWRAGDRFAQYAESVQSFSWAEFYSAYNGEQYFDWFRNQLRLLGDVVLIDSRTGVTEMGGVCTRQLADTVAVLCAPNMQNVQGCIDMVQSFRAQGLQEARGGRELNFVILPARVDDADSLGFKKFRDEVFTPMVSPLTPEVFKEWKRTSWDLEIPYKAEYSYREGLVAGVPGANEKLDTAYRDLAAHLALFTPEDHPLWSACEAELRVLATKAGKEFGAKVWVTIDRAYDQLEGEMPRAARAALLRLIRYSPQSPELDSPRRARLEEFEFPSGLAVLSTLVDRGLVSRVKDTPEDPAAEGRAAEFELPHPSLIQEWPRLKQWVREERHFLLRRQEISEQACKWRSSGLDAAALLNQTQLAAALELRAQHSERVNGIEQEFLGLSEEAAAATVRREEEVRRLEEEKARAEEESKRMQAEKAQVEAEAGKERAEHERARREARRRESRIRTAAVASLALIALVIAAGMVYVRSNRYQIGAALAAGESLEGDSSISQDALREWRRTLAASGRVAEAQASARRQTDVAPRSEMLAETAVWFSRTGQRDAAIQTATEALKPLESQPQGANLGALASVLALLAPANLLEPGRPTLETFLAAVKNVPDPLDRVDLLERIARYPLFGAARDEILRLAESSIPDPYLQFNAFMAAANAAKNANDQKTQNTAMAGARLAAHAGPADRRRSDALAVIYVLTGAPPDWNDALRAAQVLSPPEARAAALTNLLHAATNSEKARLIKETFAIAETLAPVPRLNALLGLVQAAAHSPAAQVIDNALNRHAFEIGDEDLIARAAVALAGAGDVVNSIGTARVLTPVAQARTLAKVADELQSTRGDGGQKAASELVLRAFQADARNEQLAVELIHVLPYLYPSSDAYKAVTYLNMPAAYLVWAKAAGNSDAAKQYLGKAKDLTLAMTTSDPDRAALGQIGVLYANRGELSDSRAIAKLATSPNAQLEIYTAILRYDAIQSRPQVKEFLVTRAAGR